MSKIKAENYGTCQICGRSQKHSSHSLMAKHGYKVAGYGFFAGTCHGSDNPAYEESCELLKAEVATQRKIVANLQKHHDNDFPTITDPTTTMVMKLYFLNSKTKRCEYIETLAKATKLVMDAKYEYDHDYYYMAPASENPHEGYTFITPSIFNMGESALIILNEYQTVKKVNVQAEINNRQEWINWGQARIDDWKVRGLTPVKVEVAKDTNGLRILNNLEKKAMMEVQKQGKITITDMRVNKTQFNRYWKLANEGFLTITNKTVNYVTTITVVVSNSAKASYPEMEKPLHYGDSKTAQEIWANLKVKKVLTVKGSRNYMVAIDLARYNSDRIELVEKDYMASTATIKIK